MPIPSDIQIDAPVSAKDRAKEYLCGWIIDGTLTPGEKINDAEIAKILGVSRTPVREALQILAQQGFVVMKPGVATYVNDINPDDVYKLMPPLSVLQALAADTATDLLTEDEIEHLEFINESFNKSIEKEDYYSALKKDEDFHRLIVKSCNNPYIEKIIDEYQAHVRRFYFANSISLSKESYEEHKCIIECIKNRDAKQAGSITRKNWSNLFTRGTEK